MDESPPQRTPDTDPVGQLIESFVKAALVQESATRAAKANAAALTMIDIYRRIRRAGRVAQEQFETLLAHDNVNVRLWSASFVLEFDPDPACHVLEEISAGEPGPSRADASSTLHEWRAGRLRFR